MLREYEFTVITNPQLSEVDTKKLLEKYEATFLQDGGEVLKKSSWGLRKLASPINGHFRGNYVHYDYVGKKEQLAETERLMRIDENVLRYLSIRLGEDVDVKARKVALAKSEAEAALAREREKIEK